MTPRSLERTPAGRATFSGVQLSPPSVDRNSVSESVGVPPGGTSDDPKAGSSDDPKGTNHASELPRNKNWPRRLASDLVPSAIGSLLRLRPNSLLTSILVIRVQFAP